MNKAKIKKMIIIIFILILIMIIVLIIANYIKQKKLNDISLNESSLGDSYENWSKNMASSSIRIEENEYNKYEYIDATEEKISEYLLSDYQEKVNNLPEIAYESLDEEYRNKRFGSIEEYKKYIMDNSSQIENITLLEYSSAMVDGEKFYVCIDTFNNYYLFKTKGIMQYSLILDDYTIKTEDFLKAYSSADYEKKITTDMDIFIKMINTKDYKSAYGALSEGFKNNYFKTEIDFENYVKQNFFDYNIISGKEMKIEGEICLYTVSIKGGISSEAEKIEKQFILKLGEGTDFQISFNLE